MWCSFTRTYSVSQSVNKQSRRFIQLPIILLTVLTMLLALRANAQVPTLDDYFRKPDLRGIALSPDGTQLAAIRRATEDRFHLVVYDLENKANILALIDEPEDEYFTDISWFSDQRLGVKILGTIKKGRAEFPYHRVFAMDSRGQNVVYVVSPFGTTDTKF